MRGALVYLGEKKKRQTNLILRVVLILPRLLNFLISSGFFVFFFVWLFLWGFFWGAGVATSRYSLDNDFECKDALFYYPTTKTVISSPSHLISLPPLHPIPLLQSLLHSGLLWHYLGI